MKDHSILIHLTICPYRKYKLQMYLWISFHHYKLVELPGSIYADSKLKSYIISLKSRGALAPPRPQKTMEPPLSPPSNF